MDEAEEYLALLHDDKVDGERAAAFFLGMIGQNIDPEIAVEITCTWVRAIAMGPNDSEEE